MRDGRHRPLARTAVVGRRAVLEALGRALSDDAPGVRWVVVEGPPGSGRTTVLEAAAAMAVEHGLAPGWLRADPDGACLADASADGLLDDGGGAGVLCIDELQWLDEETLARVQVLRPASGTVVVAALRSGAQALAPGRLSGVLAAAPATLVLGPLDRDDADGLLAAAGVRGGRGLADACHDLSAGSPRLLALLAEQLAGAEGPVGAGAVRSAAERLRPRVAQLCAVEIERCGPTARPVLDAALVLGDAPPLWLAAAVAGVGRPEAARAADDLVGCGLLSTADPVRLAAPLVRDALDGQLSGARRDELRRSAAAQLARTATGAEAAAEHLVAVGACGEVWPAEVLREAADLASARGEHDVAAARLERALQEPLPAAQRGELLVELGAARDRAGQPGADDAYRGALRVVDRSERPRVHLLLGRSRFGAGDYRGAVSEIDRGLQALEDPDGALGAELVAAYVAAARFDGTLEGEAQRRLAPVLDGTAPGRTAAERALLAEVALERAIRGAGRDEVLGLARRAWAGGRLLDGADAHGIALSQVAAVFTWSDAFAESDAVLTAALGRAERDGQAHVAATARYLRAWPRLYSGALADAEADVRAALDGPQWEMYEPSARAVLAHIRIDAGDPAGAREALALADADAWRETPPYAMLLEARARLHVADADLDAAAEDLAAAGEVLVTMGSRHPFCPWRSRLGLVTARRGDPSGGRALVEEELEQCRATGVPRALGVALHARALLAAADGGDAEADLRAAVEALAGAGARVEHARALTDLGRALAGKGKRGEARE
ncbi:MAG TPA: hypothetical protein VIL49_12310, partial [Capillimicrobium sp.]